LFEDVASAVEEKLYPQGIENVLGFLNHKSDVRPLRRALILFGILHDLGLLQDVQVVVPERFDFKALQTQRPKHAEVFTVACFRQSRLAVAENNRAEGEPVDFQTLRIGGKNRFQSRSPLVQLLVSCVVFYMFFSSKFA
jgi:hypothetical protein